MYIQSIKITNLKVFSELNWELDADTWLKGWHVILGANGSGKSSLIRAISFALIGLPEIYYLKQDAGRWVRNGQNVARIEFHISWSRSYDDHPNHNNIPECIIKNINIQKNSIIVAVHKNEDDKDPVTLWNNESNGWFCASFGPFRRFTGGNNDLHGLYSSHPRLARHLSVFGEDVALTEALTWLRDLRFKQLESEGRNNLLDKVRDFVNQEGFLPFGAIVIYFCRTRMNGLRAKSTGLRFPVK